MLAAKRAERKRAKLCLDLVEALPEDQRAKMAYGGVGKGREGGIHYSKPKRTAKSRLRPLY